MPAPYVAARSMECALIVVGIGNGLLLGFLTYRSQLVPRPMALFGLIGGPLMSLSGIAFSFWCLWADIGSLSAADPAASFGKPH
ncbi:DUF4386 family protein [Arthrobacter sp. Helios]|uniref:DUF4386 family protein n=1 Tax=Arthrobacter sp. Helios TaxID=2828862 RepID=UPI00204F474A|nr:DUF4386 family protein [Arthrobacter sp. Helios]UPO76381.1 DUF4386 domain-containing protein [Arthrobacter sp. Helios]